MDALLNGPFWFAGAVLLGGGALLAALLRAPSWRVRVTELAFVGMAAWLLLAVVPLPRFGSAADVRPFAGATLVVAAEGEPSPTAAVAPQPSPVAPLELPQPPLAPAASAWLPTLGQVWLLTTSLLLLWLLLGAVLLARVLARSRPADERVMQLVADLQRRLGIGGRVDVRVHDRVRAPFCCRRRTVVLPTALLEDRDALRAVLAHELAHVAAGDPLRRALFAVMTPFVALHPAWWLLRRLANQASEEAADARAALALGRVASHYARPLIELSARLQNEGVAPSLPGIVGVLGRSDSFTRRMTMLLTRDPALAARSLNRRQRVLAAASTLLMLSLSVGSWGTEAVAQDPVPTAPLDRRVRVDFADTPFKEALREVSKRTRLRIAIDEDVDERGFVIERLSLGEMPARRLFDTLSAAYELRWQMEAGRVVFRPAIAATGRAEAELDPSLPDVRSKARRDWLRAWSAIGQPSTPEGVAELLEQYRQRVADNPKDTEALVRLATRLLQHGQPADVAGLMERALELGRRDATVYGLLGHGLHKTGRREAAIEALRRALALDPERKIWRDGVANLLKELDAERTSSQSGGDPSAVPNQIRTRLLLDAQKLYRTGRYQQAVDTLRQAAARGAGDAEVHGLLGTALLDLGDRAGAAEALRRAVTLDPERRQWSLSLANALSKRAQDPESTGVLGQLLQDDSVVADVHAARAAALLRMGDSQAAQRHLEKARKVDPADAGHASMLGKLLANQKQWADARAAYTDALEHGGPDVMADAFRVAKYMIDAGARDDARAMLEKLLEISGKHGTSELEGPIRKLMKDEFGGAGGDDEQPLVWGVGISTGVGAQAQITFSKSDLAFAQAGDLVKKGDLDGACAIYERLLQDERVVDKARLLFGRVLADTGEFQRALQLVRQARRSQPDGELGRYLQALELEIQGRMATGKDPVKKRN